METKTKKYIRLVLYVLVLLSGMWLLFYLNGWRVGLPVLLIWVGTNQLRDMSEELNEKRFKALKELVLLISETLNK